MHRFLSPLAFHFYPISQGVGGVERKFFQGYQPATILATRTQSETTSGQCIIWCIPVEIQCILAADGAEFKLIEKTVCLAQHSKRVGIGQPELQLNFAVFRKSHL
jgi:hypothetical protein